MKITKAGQRLVSIATSPTAAVALFILLALAIVAGSIIPQGEMTESLVGSLSPRVMDALDTFQLFDVYHSFWFILLVTLLVLAVIACIATRIGHPPILPGGRRCPPVPQDSPALSTTIPGRSACRTADELAEIVEVHYHTASRGDTAQGTIIFGRRGPLRLISLLIIHASVLIVIVGMAMGFLLGFSAYVEIPEGDSTDTVYLREDPWKKTLPFTVTCREFSVIQYPNGTPRTYLSRLVFSGKDGDAREKTVAVNHPVSYGKIRFYQSNHGTIPEARITVTEGEHAHVFTVREGSMLQLPGTEPGQEVHILAIESNLMNLGPAIDVGIEMPDEQMRFYVFQDIEKIKESLPSVITETPRLNPGRFEPFLFQLHGIEKRFYTGLKLDYDPGLFLVLAGGLFFLIGVAMAPFSAFERIWIVLRDADSACRISVISLRGGNPAPVAPIVERYLTQREGTRT